MGPESEGFQQTEISLLMKGVSSGGMNVVGSVLKVSDEGAVDEIVQRGCLQIGAI